LAGIVFFHVPGEAILPTRLHRFLSDGKTTRTEAIITLGQPTGRFEAEKILTFRLGFEPRNNGYFVVERSSTSTFSRRT
jgi:hypothetical protein